MSYQDDLYALLKKLSPTTSAYVANRLVRGVDYRRCSARDIARHIADRAERPTIAEFQRAAVAELFGDDVTLVKARVGAPVPRT